MSNNSLPPLPTHTADDAEKAKELQTLVGVSPREEQKQPAQPPSDVFRDSPQTTAASSAPVPPLPGVLSGVPEGEENAPSHRSALDDPLTQQIVKEADTQASHDQYHNLLRKHSTVSDDADKISQATGGSGHSGSSSARRSSRIISKQDLLGGASGGSAGGLGGAMKKGGASLARFRSAALKVGQIQREETQQKIESGQMPRPRSKNLLSQASQALIMGKLGEMVRETGRVNAGSKMSKADLDAKKEEEEETTGKKALFGRSTAEDAERHAFTLVMMLATLFALFGTDLYEWGGPPDKENDMALYTVVTGVFFLFMVEFFFYTLFRPGYINSFFFYLDFIAAASLLPDVLLLFGVEVFSGAGGLTVARAGRAARAGTRAARVVRIFKLFSLIKRGKKKKKKSKLAQQHQPSKIGEVLSSGITQKVIIIVALMLVSTQILELIGTAPGFEATTATFENEVSNLEAGYGLSGNDISAEPFKSLFEEFATQRNGGTPPEDCPQAKDYMSVRDRDITSTCKLRFVKIRGEVVWGQEDVSFDDLRTTPPEILEVPGEFSNTKVVISIIATARGNGLVNILQVLFVTILLGVSTTLLNKDSNSLVIVPLETMANLVRLLSQDPLANIQVDEEEIVLDSETKMIAGALTKLSTMLQIAFGEAGAAIIGNNMKSETAEINAVIPGKRMNAIFGFCDIRNFTDCTECLQEDVMVFVNRIAQYVHHAVKDNEGAPNKNIGDAFLLAWKLDGHDKDAKCSVADSALKSYVRTVIETSTCPALREMTSRPAVQARIPGYTVRMGFGLHYGWAIEGAIGSTMKIDASYLSPNVNMAARLEAATKQYGVTFLISEAMYELFSPGVQQLCRRLDRVTVKGSNVPMELYTYDVNPRPSLRSIKAGGTFWEQFEPLTTAEWRGTFAKGVKAYLDGRWPDAIKAIHECQETMPDDVPSKVLLEVMQEYKNVAPASWKGYRELTEK